MAFQGDSIYWVEVEKVVPNPFQPRIEFDESKLQELADSIRMYGVLQPLTVTRSEVQKDDGTFYTEYELIAGERRLRASKLAGTAQVPVIIREGEQSQQEKLELAIIENLQREDLNAVDRSLAFKQLSEVFELSHTQVAKKVGRSREYVANSIRLLALPENVLTALKQGQISEGAARTLLMLSDKPEEQQVIFKEVILKKLSVREVERIVRKIATDKVRKKSPGEFDATLLEFEKQFTETLGTRVQIQKTEFGGKLTIDYFSEGDLEVILKKVKDEEMKIKNTLEQSHKLASGTPLEVTVPVVEPKVDQSAKLTPVSEVEATPKPRSYFSNNTPEQNIVTPKPDPVLLTKEDAPLVSVEKEEESVLSSFVNQVKSVVESPVIEPAREQVQQDAALLASDSNRPTEQTNSYFSQPRVEPKLQVEKKSEVVETEKSVFNYNPEPQLPQNTVPVEEEKKAESTVPNFSTLPTVVDRQENTSPEPAVETAKDSTEDDSSLYSMNNFNV